MLAAKVLRRQRAGITLTEILIAIFIMAIGLISLATLFPIGLLRLRDAARSSRSAYLVESASADLVSRGLLTTQSFIYADVFNNNAGNPLWYYTGSISAGTGSGRYDPFIQDTPAYGSDWASDTNYGPGAYAGAGGTLVGHGSATNPTQGTTNGLPSINGPGLPFAYDPLWRFQTLYGPTTGTYTGSNGGLVNGTYPDPYNFYKLGIPEARFGSGDGWNFRPDPTGGAASAHGLQRISNFSPAMPASAFVPSIFVSPEDIVWQEAANQNYHIAWNTGSPVGPTPSTVVPDLSFSRDSNNNLNYQPSIDWRYSWMFTGQITNSSNEACFDGNVVIFENRPFGIAPSATGYQVDGETVVEAVYSYSSNTNININGTYGYGIGADRTVLLRWPASNPDPTVRVGDWIADVTYERAQNIVQSRWWQGYTIPNTTIPAPFGIANPNNNSEWDNLPAQRCFWYQVQKVTPVETASGKFVFSTDPSTYRYMMISVNQSLQARTLLQNGSNGVEPAVINAALICPSVINVIPRTIFVR